MSDRSDETEEIDERQRRYYARLESDPAFARSERRKHRTLDLLFPPQPPPPGAQRHLSPGPPLPVYGREEPLYADGDGPEDYPDEAESRS